MKIKSLTTKIVLAVVCVLMFTAGFLSLALNTNGNKAFATTGNALLQTTITTDNMWNSGAKTKNLIVTPKLPSYNNGDGKDNSKWKSNWNNVMVASGWGSANISGDDGALQVFTTKALDDTTDTFAIRCVKSGTFGGGDACLGSDADNSPFAQPILNGGISYTVKLSSNDQTVADNGHLKTSFKAEFYRQKVYYYGMSLKAEFYNASGTLISSEYKSWGDYGASDGYLSRSVKGVAVPKNTVYIRYWFADYGLGNARKAVKNMQAYLYDNTPAPTKTHDGVTFTAWEKSDSLPTSGEHFLTSDVKLTSTWAPTGNVKLCLNGYKIIANADLTAINVASGVTFNVYDCTEAGEITHASDKTGTGVETSGTFNFYGGKITGNGGETYGNRGGGVLVKKGTFNMYGGEITNNKLGDARGAGVSVGNSITDSANATFNMYGGEIYGNTVAKAHGSAVSLGGATTGGSYLFYFNMTGGKIYGNTTSSVGEADAVVVDKNGRFTMSGGEIIENRNGVYLEGGFLTLSGTAKITANGSDTNGHNVRLGIDESSKHRYLTIGNGGLTGDAKIGVSLISGHDKQISSGTEYATNTDYASSDTLNYMYLEDSTQKLYYDNTEKAIMVDEGHAHANIEFNILSITSGTFAESGYYYLGTDVTADGDITIGKDQTVTLCLNGHTLKMGEHSIINKENLTICDCTETSAEDVGEIEGNGDAVIQNDGELTMDNGNVKNSNNTGRPAIQNNGNGTLNMRGGEFNSSNGTAIENNGGKVTAEEGVSITTGSGDKEKAQIPPHTCEYSTGSCACGNVALVFSSESSFSLKTINSTKNWDGTLEYSTDATTWSTWNGTSVDSGSDKKIYLRGTGNTVITGAYDSTKSFQFIISKNISCSGNIETLLDYGAVMKDEHPTMGDYAFASLFANCPIMSAPELPATTLTTGCYADMFNYCSLLETAPELPATTLATECYYEMFTYSGLKTAPELPATTLADFCYTGMFSNCENLKTAPELPATTLADVCYTNMFVNCTSLETAPKLSATTLTESCYANMFVGCTSLETAPELPATILAAGCYSMMFYNCSGLKTAPKLPATTLTENCYKEMFYGCTSLTELPELPATALESGCYKSMFENCTGIKVSETKVGEYTKEFKLPGESTTYSVPYVDNMFGSTGGTFTGTPKLGTTYYLPEPPHAHEGIDEEFSVWTGTNISRKGYYYLTEDINATSDISISSGGYSLTICLNGHDINMGGYQLRTESFVTICDCNTAHGSITSSVSESNEATIRYGTELNLENVDVIQDGTAYGNAMYGGGTLTIKNCNISGYRAIWSNGGTIIVDDSTITGINSAAIGTFETSIRINSGTILSLYGSAISLNGTVYLSGTPEINGTTNDVRFSGNAVIYASNADNTVSYSGQAITIDFYTAYSYLNYSIVKNVTSANEDKFSVINEGYALVRGTGEYENNLILAIPPHTHTGVDGEFTELTDLNQLASSGNYYLGDTIPAVSGDISIASGVEITLCLNGKTFDLGNDRIINRGTLTICDCHTLEAEYGKITSSTNGYNGGSVQNIGGKLYITGGKIENTSNQSSAVYNSSEEGVIEITGGNIYAYKGKGITNSKGTLTLQNCTVQGESNYAVVASGGGKVFIKEGATIIGGTNGVYNNGGEVTISGGSVTSSTSQVIYNSYGGTITITSGNVSATSSNQCAIYNMGTLNVSGGSVISDLGYAIENNGGTDKIAKVVISGGTISGTVGIESQTTFTSVSISGDSVITGSSTGAIVRGDNNEILGGTITGVTGNGVQNSGILTISGGTITGNKIGVSNFKTLTITGGTITGVIYGINNEWDTETVTITGGTIKATEGNGISGGATVDISGGKIIGSNYGICIDSVDTKVYLSSNPTITGATANIGYMSHGVVYTHSLDDTTAYSGEALTINYTLPSDGVISVCDVTDANKDKFSVINSGYLLILGSGENADDLVLHKHSYSTVKYDATNHWKECSCDEKQSITAHQTTGLCSCGGVLINENNFKDANFRTYLMELTSGADGFFSTSELAQITEINVENKNIASLEGIKYFSALEKLDCNNNQLTEIDVSENLSLKDFICYGNKLTEIDVSKNLALENFECDSNALTKLDVSKNVNLISLSCVSNKLTALDLTNNTSLVNFYCDYNHITSLDISNTKIGNFSASSQTIEIIIDHKTMSFDIATIDSNFDAEKAQVTVEGWSFNGTVLIVKEGGESVMFGYKAGRSDYMVWIKATIKNPHTHAIVNADTDCTTNELCSCEKVIVAKNESHGYDNACDNACNTTGCTAGNRITSHVPNTDDGDCTTAIKCSICDTVTTPALAHGFTDNNDSTCNNSDCSFTRHIHDDIIFDTVMTEMTAETLEFSSDCSVVLTGDITCNSIVINYGVTVNLCLNGHSIDLGTGYLTNYGKLNICDCASGGVITSSTPTSTNYRGTIFIDGGKVYLRSGTISNTAGVAIYGLKSSSCTIEVYGGTVSGEECAITSGGSNSILINGGQIIGKGTGMSIAGSGIANIKGGKIIGGEEALMIQGDVGVYISGGEISSTTSYGIINYGNTRFTISGGSITGEYGVLLNLEATMSLYKAPVIKGQVADVSVSSKSNIISSYSYFSAGGTVTEYYTGNTLTLEVMYHDEGSIVVEKVNDDTANKFSVINEGYGLVRGTGENANALLYHKHSYSYTASNNIITETCSCGHNQNVTINKPSGDTYTYDGTTEFKASVTYSVNWIADKDLVISYTRAGNSTTDFISAGTIVVSITKDSKTATLTYTIAKASQSAPSSVDKVGTTYIDTTDGKITGVTNAMEYMLSTASDWTPISGTEITNLASGTYYVRFKETDNYNASDYVSVTIIKGEKRTATLTNISDVGKTYNGTAVSNPAYTYGGDGEITITWYADNGGVKGNALSSAPTNAGTYWVGIKASEGTNYKAVSEVTRKFVISKVQITKPTADNTVFTYNGQQQAYSIATNTNYTISNNTMTNAGSQTVTVSLKNTVNYEWADGSITNLSFTFKINKAQVVKPTADDTVFTYNGLAQVYTIAENGLYTISGNARTDAGSQNVVVSLKDSSNYAWNDGTSSNLTFSFVINKANAVITVDTTDIVKTYGDVWTLPKASTNFGEVVCDKVITDFINVNTYTITYTVADTSNYNGDFKTVKVIINKATLDMSDISFADYTVVENGEEFKLAISGTLPDGVTVEYANNGQSQVGVYEITASFIYDKDNYNVVEPMKATLTINQAQIKDHIGETTTEPPHVEVTTEGGFAPNIEIIIAEVTSKDNKVEEVLETFDKVSAVYDITMESDGVKVQPNAQITIKLKIPTELNGKEFRIYHNHNGEISEVEYSVEGEYAVFEVDKLSEFSFVYFNFPWWIVILCVGIVLATTGAVTAIVIYKKKSKKA